MIPAWRCYWCRVLNIWTGQKQWCTNCGRYKAK